MTALLYVALGILGIFMIFAVHVALVHCYIAYAVRSCRKRGYKPSRCRCCPAFDGRVKTEYSIVELDCLSPDKQRTLVRLLVWAFGVRETLAIEPFVEKPGEDSTWAEVR